MMIRIRGENGSRGNGRRRRGMERGGGGYTTILHERANLPQPFSERPCTSMYVRSNFSKNLTACTRQELCLSDDTTTRTRFGFFTTDVDVDIDVVRERSVMTALRENGRSGWS